MKENETEKKYQAQIISMLDEQIANGKITIAEKEEFIENGRKHNVLSEASSAIKPGIWFTSINSETSKNASKEEISILEELTQTTTELKKKSWKIDQEISSILKKIMQRTIKSEKQSYSDSSEGVPEVTEA